MDDCVGVIDECGVCNGAGPTEVVIEDITILYDSVYAANIDTWFVYEIGADTTFSFTCAPSCGDPVSYQGYDYATLLIGDQCWFTENLRSESYENGDAIPANLSDYEWEFTTSGAVAVYGEDAGCNNYSPDIDACDLAQSLNEYGRLYNWYAVDDARGLCPSGWHIPTDEEWMTMEMALGMSESEANDTGWRGTDQGTQMKTDYGWYNGGNGSILERLFRFAGRLPLPQWTLQLRWRPRLLVEFLAHAGSFAWFRYLSSSNEDVNRYFTSQRYGFSVRCVRDAE